MRIIKHPLLPHVEKQTVTIYYNDEPLEALEGEPIAAALMAAGIRNMRTTAKRNEPRGVFCAIGRCTDCMMIVDGMPNTRTCVTSVREGIRVEHQDGLVSLKPAGQLTLTKQSVIPIQPEGTGADHA